ncbi:hypothetical protein PMAYCL1PPCAC_25195, partial [Pristionchus mayeri]
DQAGMKDTPPDEIIRVELEELSKIDIHYSPEVVVKGVTWKAFAYMRGGGIIGSGLLCTHNQFTPWSFIVNAEFILVHPDNGDNLTVEKSAVFNNSDGDIATRVGKNTDTVKKFIKNDKIIVEFRFWISEMKGIK